MTDVCPIAYFGEPVVDASLFSFLNAGEAVEAEGYGCTEDNYNVKLNIDRCSEFIAQVPWSYHKEVEQDLRCSSSYVREVEIK